MIITEHKRSISSCCWKISRIAFFTDISSKQKRTVLLVMKVGKKEGKRKLVYASTTGNTKKRGSKLDLLISSPYYEVDVLLGWWLFFQYLVGRLARNSTTQSRLKLRQKYAYNCNSYHYYHISIFLQYVLETSMSSFLVQITNDLLF